MFSPGSTAAGDVIWYGIFTGVNHTQRGDEKPEVDQFGAYWTSFVVQPLALYSGQIADAKVVGADGYTNFLSGLSEGDPYGLGWGHNANSPEELAAQYPASPVTLSFNTLNQGAFSLPMPWPQKPSSMDPPQLINFGAAQSIDPTRPFTLRWLPISGARSHDLLFVSMGTFRSAGYPGEPGYITLLGTDTSIEIPAYALPVREEQGLFGSIGFETDTLVDAHSLPQATGYSGYLRNTQFSFGTKPPLLDGPTGLSLSVSNDFVVLEWDAHHAPADLERKLGRIDAPWTGFMQAAQSGTLLPRLATPSTFFRLAFRPPRLLEEPRSLTVNHGSGVRLAVRAEGTAPLFYQWELGGTEVFGANGPVLELPYVRSWDQGVYKVRVNNRAGSVTSSGATVTVTSRNVAPQSVAGIYLGQVVGFDNEGGFALLMRNDGTGSFLGSSPPGFGTPLRGAVTLSSEGGFTSELPEGGTVEGEILGLIVTGEAGTGPGFSFSLSGTRRAAVGPHQSAAGMYEGTYAGDLEGQAYGTLAADGRLLLVIAGPLGEEGWFAQAGADGQFEIHSESTLVFQGRINPQTRTISGTYQSGPGGGGTFQLTLQ